MRKGLVALSLMTAAVGMAASFSAVTYASFTSSANISQTIGVKRSIYLDVASTAWNDGTTLFGAWVWKNGESGFFADAESFMQRVAGTNRYRITLPSTANNVIFVKHTDGATASWSTLKKTEYPKVAFQTIDIAISPTWDTYTITSNADSYTDDGYQKWTGTTSLIYSS